MDSDFVVGMSIGNAAAGRVAAAAERTAAAFEETARYWKHESKADNGLLFAVFDALATVPIEASVEVLLAIRKNLGPATRTRFQKRGLSARDADFKSQEFMKKLEAAWTKTAAAAAASAAVRKSKP